MCLCWWQAIDQQLQQAQRKTEAHLVPLEQKAEALRAEVEGLKDKRVAVERERVLGRWLEKTDEAYLDAFAHRLRRGTYRGVFVQTRGSFNANRAKAGSGEEGKPDEVWWKKSKDEENEAGGVSEEELVQFLPKRDAFGDPHFPRGGYWPSCAVVGTSGLLLRYVQGELIDSHDAVFR